MYLCSSTISSNGHFIDPPPPPPYVYPLDIVYIFFLLFLLHRQPAATGLYIQTPKKNRSASIYFLPLYILYVHDKENLNGLFSSRSGYSIFHLTLEIKGNYYPMAVGCGHIYRRFYWSTNVYASIVYNNWNMDSYAHRSYWSPRWVGSFTPSDRSGSATLQPAEGKFFEYF